MSCNVLLHKYTRHTRTLPLLTNLEAAARQTYVVYVGSFTKVVIVTHERALGERS
jgi:hypothetical protein